MESVSRAAGPAARGGGQGDPRGHPQPRRRGRAVRRHDLPAPEGGIRAGAGQVGGSGMGGRAAAARPLARQLLKPRGVPPYDRSEGHEKAAVVVIGGACLLAAAAARRPLCLSTAGRRDDLLGGPTRPTRRARERAALLPERGSRGLRAGPAARSPIRRGDAGPGADDRPATRRFALCGARPGARPADRARAPARGHAAGAARRPRRTRPLKLAQAIHEKYPDDIRAAMMLARHEIEQGHTERALEIFTELLAVEPNNAVAYNQHRLLLRLPRRLRQGDREPAEVPVHGARSGQSLRQPRRDPGVLGPLRRGDREPQAGSAHQARLLPAYGTWASPTRARETTRARSSPTGGRRRTPSTTRCGASCLREALPVALRERRTPRQAAEQIAETAPFPGQEPRDHRSWRCDAFRPARRTGPRRPSGASARSGRSSSRPFRRDDRQEGKRPSLRRGLELSDGPGPGAQGKARRGDRPLRGDGQSAQSLGRASRSAAGSTRAERCSPSSSRARAISTARKSCSPRTTSGTRAGRRRAPSEARRGAAAAREGARGVEVANAPSMESAGRDFETQHKLLLLETLYDAGLSLGLASDEEALVEDVLGRAVGVLDASRGIPRDLRRRRRPPRGGARRLSRAACRNPSSRRTSSCATCSRPKPRCAARSSGFLRTPVSAAIGVPIRGGGRGPSACSSWRTRSCAAARKPPSTRRTRASSPPSRVSAGWRSRTAGTWSG